MPTRERIVEEATKQLLECGYDAFTVASVRDVLGLSSGSMFHAFDSKPALVAEIFVSGMREYQQVATEAIGSHDRPDRAVGAWITAHLEWVTGNRDLARFLFSTQPDAVRERAVAPLAEANSVFYATVDALFARAVDHGLMAPTAFAIAYALTLGPAQDYCRRWARGEAQLVPADLANEFSAAAVAALASTMRGS